MVTKAQRAAQMLLNGVDPAAEESYSIMVRMPGELAERVFALYDMSDGSVKDRRANLSRNKLLVALIEAGIEAAEQATPAKKGAR